MKLFKNLFKKKEKEKIKKEIIPEETSDLICAYCGMGINGEQKIKTFNGKKYHLKPCWRKLQKEAMNSFKGKS